MLGGGQPSMNQPTYDYIDLMYTALVADGSQLPPVIFTNDPNVPQHVEGTQVASVIYIPTLSSTPSANITTCWLDTVSEYLEDEPHLIHDSGGEFVSKVSQAAFRDIDIHSHQIPAAGGAYLNPCDNNFHHNMKQHYYAKRYRTHAEMLRGMIDAYYEVADKNIQHYFKHTRIIGKIVTKHHIAHLLSEGYHPGKAHEEVHLRCIGAYAAWKKNICHLNNNTHPKKHFECIQDTSTGGVYWYPSCRNKK